MEQRSLCVSHTDLGSAPRTALVFTRISFFLLVFTHDCPRPAPPYAHVRKLLMRPRMSVLGRRL